MLIEIHCNNNKPKIKLYASRSLLLCMIQSSWNEYSLSTTATAKRVNAPQKTKQKKTDREIEKEIIKKYI